MHQRPHQEPFQAQALHLAHCAQGPPGLPQQHRPTASRQGQQQRAAGGPAPASSVPCRLDGSPSTVQFAAEELQDWLAAAEDLAGLLMDGADEQGGGAVQGCGAQAAADVAWACGELCVRTREWERWAQRSACPTSPLQEKIGGGGQEAGRAPLPSLQAGFAAKGIGGSRGAGQSVADVQRAAPGGGSGGSWGAASLAGVRAGSSGGHGLSQQLVALAARAAAVRRRLRAAVAHTLCVGQPPELWVPAPPPRALACLLKGLAQARLRPDTRCVCRSMCW